MFSRDVLNKLRFKFKYILKDTMTPFLSKIAQFWLFYWGFIFNSKCLFKSIIKYTLNKLKPCFNANSALMSYYTIVCYFNQGLV